MPTLLEERRRWSSQINVGSTAHVELTRPTLFVARSIPPKTAHRDPRPPFVPGPTNAPLRFSSGPRRWRRANVASSSHIDPHRPNLEVTTPPASRNEDFHRDPLRPFTPLGFVTRAHHVDRGPNIARSYAGNVKNMHAAPSIAVKLDRFRGHRG
jgi:hypothetical protein